MKNYKVLSLQILTVAALLGVFVVSARFERWKEKQYKEQAPRILIELTPEKLIAICGSPESDEISHQVALFDDPPKPAFRYIRYGAPQARKFAKLTFTPILDINPEKPSQWR